MAIREFASTYYPGLDENPAPLPVKADMKKRPIPIGPAKPKQVRKAKGLAKHPCVSVTWYESEDRTLPSVSSF